MKLEGLRTFATQVTEEFGSEVINSGLYYFYEEKWHALATEQPCSDSNSNSLERARVDQIAYHATSSPDAWFYLPIGACAVRLTFAQSPQLATRRKIRERLLKLQESASNAYRVAHNPLTHLLARDAFRSRLTAAIAEVDQRDLPASEAQESGVPRTLAVLALDIDHFKQINDTWGHLYGDQVLKTFGRRLERCADGIRSGGVGNPTIHLGHPSGEEFLITIHANAGRDQFISWANDFRKCISEESLPSDREWNWLKTTDNISTLSPPPIHERATSVSVGIALYGASAKSDPGVEPVSMLLDRADTALYRAKAAGRNQVIAFDDILSNCGRVLEQDVGSKVLALDIGANVGVAVGQEFKVFSPTFSGKTKFMLNDGRTKRTLGIYPRVESTRVVVFNTQPEISFAFFADSSEANLIIEAGSHLEAIPAGSIGHLLPSSSKYFPDASDVSNRSSYAEMQSYVKAKAEQDTAPFAVVVRFNREAEYMRKYGSVSLNIALAQMYREAQLTFHTAAFVEAIDRGSICIVGPKTGYKEALVIAFTERMAAEFPELGVFSGVFCESDLASKGTTEATALAPVHAIEFARFAAADGGRSPDSRVRHFSYATANAVLQALRESQSFDIAYADFERLRELGVESASLLNLGGLIAGSLGLRQQAVELYLAAVNRDPKNLIYKSNYGTAAYRVGEIEPALKVLNALPLKDIDSLLTRHSYGYVTYARLLARAKLAAHPTFDSARFEHVAQTALDLPEYINSPETAVIREALGLQ